MPRGRRSTLVDGRRDGAIVAAAVAGGSYTDNIGQKGGGSYSYRVCEAGGTSVCSNTATVNF